MTKENVLRICNSNWSFKLVDSTSNHRIWIRFIYADILAFNKTPMWLGKHAIYQYLVLVVVIFDIQRSMTCKKGGFIYIQLNDLRDLQANTMSET